MQTNWFHYNYLLLSIPIYNYIYNSNSQKSLGVFKKTGLLQPLRFVHGVFGRLVATRANPGHRPIARTVMLPSPWLPKHVSWHCGNQIFVAISVVKCGKSGNCNSWCFLNKRPPCELNLAAPRELIGELNYWTMVTKNQHGNSFVSLNSGKLLKTHW